MTRCHDCLLVQEILLGIFSDLSQNHLYVAALVCKAWLEPALIVLWEEVQLVDLLGVLSPLSTETGGKLVGVYKLCTYNRF